MEAPGQAQRRQDNDDAAKLLPNRVLNGINLDAAG